MKITYISLLICFLAIPHTTKSSIQELNKELLNSCKARFAYAQHKSTTVKDKVKINNLILRAQANSGRQAKTALPLICTIYFFIPGAALLLPPIADRNNNLNQTQKIICALTGISWIALGGTTLKKGIAQNKTLVAESIRRINVNNALRNHHKQKKQLLAHAVDTIKQAVRA